MIDVPVGYKQTDVGVIPEDWEVKLFGDVTTSISSGKSDTKSKIGNYPIYGSTGIIGYQHHFDYYGNKILVARVGANAGTINRVYNKYCVSDNTLMVTCKNNISLDFCFYQLIRKNLNSLVFGSGQPLITGGQLKNILFILPPLTEQTAIATALSDVDALLNQLDKLIAKKRDIKQATMQQLLTGKKRLAGFGDGKGYKQTEIGDIPEDWNIDFIKNHCVITTGSKNTQDRIEEGEYPFFVRSQKVEQINSYSFDGEAVLTAGDGVGTGKVFHYINGKFDLHQRVYKMSNFSESLDGYFFYLYFRNNFYSRIMQMTAKSSVDSVRMEMIADMKIPLPPTKTEQTAIATLLTDMDNQITQLQQRRHKTHALKQGMMQQLLTGKIRLI